MLEWHSMWIDPAVNNHERTRSLITAPKPRSKKRTRIRHYAVFWLS